MIEITSSFKTEHYPTRYLAYVNHVGPYRGDVVLFERLFNQAMAWVQSNGLMTPTSEAITIYYDDPDKVPENEHRINVGFTIPAGYEGKGDIEIVEIPEGDYLVGSFEVLPEEYGEAWNEMFEYINDNNLKPREWPMYESYKNDPKTHPEGKHLVDICISLN